MFFPFLTDGLIIRCVLLELEILRGGCLTVMNYWELFTGDDVTDLEISISV